MNSRTFTFAQVALRLGCSRSRVFDIVKSGQMRAIQIGTGERMRRVSEADLAAYIEARRQDAGIVDTTNPPPPTSDVGGLYRG